MGYVYKLDGFCMGDLIRAKESLLNQEKITKKEYDVITKYLGLIINDEVS